MAAPLPFDMAAAKTQVRRTVHNTMRVSALYYENDSVVVPTPIFARWHNKIDRFGDLESTGYAEFVQGIDRIVFIPSDHPGLVLVKDGRIDFPVYGNSFSLTVKETNSGPLEEVWQVAAL